MAGQIRRNNELTKLAYKILKTEKDQQQKNQKVPPERLVRQWWIDSSTAQ